MIITDILMPKMDGYSLAHTLRKDPLTLTIPIVFISATYITPEDKAFALSLGAVRFIEKPIDTECLLETLPAEQQPAFQALLNSAVNDHDQIQEELDNLLNLLTDIEKKAKV